MRTLVVEPAGGLWGSERALLDLIDASSEVQFAVCCPPDTPLVRELERRGVTILPWFVERLHEKSRRRRGQAALGVLRACLAFRPDVIHINQSGSWRVTSPAATLLNLSVVCHVRIFEDAAYLANCRPNPRRLKAIIAISGAVEEEIRSFQGLDSIPVRRIYDTYIRTLAPLLEGRVRGRIACVGRVTPIKGQALLLEAMNHAVVPKNVECLVVGDGEAGYVVGLKAGAPPSVIWRGFVDDVVGLLQTCSVLACPSHREPLGRVIFEAWDAGVVPVVYSGSGGAAEAVAAAGGGLLYDEQTPEALACALAKAVALDPSEAWQFVERGRAWLAANCASGPYGRAVEDVLVKATV